MNFSSTKSLSDRYDVCTGGSGAVRLGYIRNDALSLDAPHGPCDKMLCNVWASEAVLAPFDVVPVGGWICLRVGPCNGYIEVGCGRVVADAFADRLSSGRPRVSFEHGFFEYG